MTFSARQLRGIGRLFRILVFAALAVQLPAQSAPVPGFLDVGSERERFLRLLQVVGDVPLYPWTIRGFGPAELARLQPRDGSRWGDPRDLRSGVTRGVSWRVLSVHMPLVYNTGFPFGIADGPIWAGRGATVAVQGGIAARTGPFSIQLEPLAFAALNRAFPLYGADRSGKFVYANEFAPIQIDVPQRFGNSTYTRLDGGQSSIRVDLGPVAAAFSTANQFWGPAQENPIILGDNAAGFPHAFLGTARPVGIGIGHVHGRVVWGQLNQSAYSPQEGVGERRFIAAVVGVFVPRGLPGLELGASRFSHMVWPENGILDANFLKPFQGVIARKLTQSQLPQSEVPADNELGALFFRWVLPRQGFEFYGEYGREDKFIDWRDLTLEPDHSAAYLLGLQRVWRRAPATLFAVRAELLNTRASHLNQARAQAPWYTHSGLNQGHTHYGQFLGSPGGFGGGAALVALDRYEPSGRWTLRWSRLMRAENGLRAPFTPAPPFEQPPNPRINDVIYTWGVERLVFLTRFEVTAGVAGVWDLNRDFGRDQFDWNLRLGVRTRR